MVPEPPRAKTHKLQKTLGDFFGNASNANTETSKKTPSDNTSQQRSPLKKVT